MAYDYEGAARDLLRSLRLCGPGARAPLLAAALKHVHEAGRRAGIGYSDRMWAALQRRIDHARELHPSECRCNTCAALDCPYGETRHYAAGGCPRCDAPPEPPRGARA